MNEGSPFQAGLDLLRLQRDLFKTPGLGASVDALERLASGQASASSIHGVIARLPLMARIAVAVADAPDARGELERVVRGLEEQFMDQRTRQARKSFAKFGAALGVTRFEDYLGGTDSLEPVPEITVFADRLMTSFNETLLVDGRVLDDQERKIGLSETCKLAGLAFNGNDNTFTSRDPEVAGSGIRWIRFQDGRRNHGRNPRSCIESFADCEVGADVMEGIARFVQDELVLWKRFMDLPGSVLASHRDYCACLGVCFDGPKLSWRWDVFAFPVYGSASRGK